MIVPRMKKIVYYDCLSYIVFINFRALFRIRTEARTRVLTEMSEICLHKNEVGGYAYNNENTLLTQIGRVLERHLYGDFANRMKGLASNVSNALN